MRNPEMIALQIAVSDLTFGAKHKAEAKGRALGRHIITLLEHPTDLDGQARALVLLLDLNAASGHTAELLIDRAWLLPPQK